MASVISASTTSATALNMSADTTGVLQLATGATPTTAVTIDTSQNVGIGTTATTYNYQTKNIALYDASSSGISVVGGSKLLTITSQSSGGCFVGTRSNDDLKFTTNDTERMRIDSNGNLWFNTSTFSSSMQSGLSLQTASNSQLWVSHANGTGSGQYYAVFFYNGSNIGGVTQNGTTAVAYNTSSDYRLKDNIAPMTGALDKVALLKPVTYKWKIDGSDGQGFIAHELAEVVPDCVSGEKDAVDEEGNIKPQGIDTSFLVATLTAAIQEMKSIIDEQSARITALENK